MTRHRLQALVWTTTLTVLTANALAQGPGWPPGPGRQNKGEQPADYVARRAKELAADDLYGHLELADLAKSTGVDEAAKEHAEIALSIEPKNHLAHQILGHTYYNRKWLTPDEAQEAGLLEFNGEWLPPKAHAEHVKRSDWEHAWEVNEKGIRLRTNTSLRKGQKYYDAFKQFKEDMQRTFKVKLSKKYTVNIYATKDQYHTIAHAPMGTGGYYSPGEREFHFFDDPDFYQSRRIFFHEGTHMFTHLTQKNMAFHYPNWLNEGMAEYFGGSKLDYEKETYSFGHILNDRLEVIQAKLKAGRHEPLEQFISKEDLDGAYDQGWSLAMFLIKRDDGKWARQFGVYLKQLRESPVAMQTDGPRGGAALDSFRKIFLRRGQTLQEFEDEWKEFVLALKPEPGAPDFRNMKSMH